MQNNVIELDNGKGEKGYFYLGSDTIRFGEYGEYPVISYSGGKSSIPNVNRDIEDKLLLLGFLEGLEEISRIWLKMPRIQGYAVNWIIVIPIYLNILEEKIVGGNELHVKFKVHKSLKQTLNMTIALRREIEGSWTPIENARFSAEHFSCRESADDSFLICEVKYPFNVLPNHKDRVYWAISNPLGILSYNSYNGVEVSQLIGKKDLGDTFLNTFTQFISLDDLKEILEGKKSKELRPSPSEDFQRAVVYLLSLIGFRTVELGDVRNQEYRVVKERSGVHIGDVDIIAEDIDTKTLYVIDCKLNPPEARDIDVIANIAKSLREKGIMVEPLIIVGNSATESKENVRRVKIIDQDDLLKVIQNVRRGNIKQAKELITDFLD
ncbi:hypothetical protein [Pyrococcus kukulkanii]|uniref:Uncharacterized protein n=1 Tax=Pyrococcus kukulkanii TaxID=1609559 RepID=A0A127B7X9_9EURY|nr:hypothetical protein [Pyrococcus kukulkanii]AMM53492.1 hypothetical protein TQ32_02555 [Pyrococcus kukulkanii]